MFFLQSIFVKVFAPQRFQRGSGVLFGNEGRLIEEGKPFVVRKAGFIGRSIATRRIQRHYFSYGDAIASSWVTVCMGSPFSST
jgi:hypothetical protein